MLRKVKSLQTKFRLPNLLIQDESLSRTGTWKDRRSEFILKKAKKQKIGKLCLITSGNAGYSLGYLARRYKIKVICVVDKNLPLRIKKPLRDVAAKVIEVELSKKIFHPKETLTFARERIHERLWDVTNGFEEAYEKIIQEVASAAPDYIICPVGSGEAYVGLYRAIRKYNLKTKLIGVSPRSSSSFADKLSTKWTPYQRKMTNIKRKGHTIMKLSEKEIRLAYQKYRKYLRCEPSSAIVLGALGKLRIARNKTVVVINSGKGLT